MVNGSQKPFNKSGKSIVSIHLQSVGLVINVTYSKISTRCSVCRIAKNIAQMESLLDMKLESQPRSRRDIDTVYIVANSAELTLLKPFIEVAINPDTTQPKLFSSSRSNSSNQYEDLSGVTFSDIPLLLKPQAATKEQMEDLWPKDSNAEKRLKAMGMDAYTLMTSLPQMKAVEGYQVQGQTGTLSIDKQCIVQQELTWGEYGSL